MNRNHQMFRPCQADDGSPDEECDITFMSGYMPEIESAVIDTDKLALDESRNQCQLKSLLKWQPRIRLYSKSLELSGDSPYMLI